MRLDEGKGDIATAGLWVGAGAMNPTAGAGPQAPRQACGCASQALETAEGAWQSPSPEQGAAWGGEQMRWCYWR